MANEATITLTGNATADAELKFLQSGAAVANFTVAVTPRVKQGDQWTDGQAAFYRVAAWKQLGENVADSVKKGDRVTVVGRLTPREYEHNGEKRTSLDVNADSVGLDLQFRSARAGEKTQASGGGQSWGGQSSPQSDPWNASPAPF